MKRFFMIEIIIGILKETERCIFKRFGINIGTGYY